MIPIHTEKSPRAPGLVLRADVRVDFDAATDTAVLRGPVTSLALRPVRGALRTVLDRLAEGPLPQEEL